MNHEPVDPVESSSRSAAASVQLRVGDYIKDNDPRMDWRLPLRIFEILPDGRVAAENVRGDVFRISIRRIHTDCKPRKSGFDLVASGSGSIEHTDRMNERGS